MADSNQSPAHPLDEGHYVINDEALEFMKSQTGIKDAEELKKHIIQVQTDACVVSPRFMSRLLTDRHIGSSIPVHPKFQLP